MNKITDFFLKILFFIIFFLVVTPFGLLLRLFGIDYLQRRLEKEKNSYWTEQSKG